MKKIVFLVLLFLLASPVFCQRRPLMEVCQEMNNVRMLVGSNSTEVSEIIIDRINEQLLSNPELMESLKPFNGIVFSAQINYNSTSCFNGSFMMNDSKLQYVRFEPDPLAGTSDSNILFYMELIGVENAIVSLSNLADADKENIIDSVMATVKTWVSLIMNMLSGDFKVEPISGFVKVVNGFMLAVQENIGEMILNIDISTLEASN